MIHPIISTGTRAPNNRQGAIQNQSRSPAKQVDFQSQFPNLSSRLRNKNKNGGIHCNQYITIITIILSKESSETNALVAVRKLGSRTLPQFTRWRAGRPRRPEGSSLRELTSWTGVHHPYRSNLSLLVIAIFVL